MDSQCPGCLGRAVVTLRLPSAIVESPWRHKRVPFVNIASGRSRSIKRRQWKHKMDYYGVVFAHLATGRGINAKDPSGLDSDRWIPHSRCCENPARAKALAGFSRHLSAGFTDLNPAPRGLSLYNTRASVATVLTTPCVFQCLMVNSLWPRDIVWLYRFGSKPAQLTHWGRGKMADISQTTYSYAFSGMKICEFRLMFHFILCLRVKLTIFQHWFR